MQGSVLPEVYLHPHPIPACRYSYQASKTVILVNLTYNGMPVFAGIYGSCNICHAMVVI